MDKALLCLFFAFFFFSSVKGCYDILYQSAYLMVNHLPIKTAKVKTYMADGLVLCSSLFIAKYSWSLDALEIFDQYFKGDVFRYREIVTNVFAGLMAIITAVTFYLMIYAILCTIKHIFVDSVSHTLTQKSKEDVADVHKD